MQATTDVYGDAAYHVLVNLKDKGTDNIRVEKKRRVNAGNGKVGNIYKGD